MSFQRRTAPPPDLTQALALHRQGRLAAAERLYAAALAAAPKDPRALYLIGLCRLEQGDLAGGARYMRSLVKLRPSNAAAHHALGKALVMMGRRKQGQRHLTRALRLDPHLTDSRLELGALAAAAGRFAEAEALYRDGLAIDAADARLWTNLGEALRQQQREPEAFEAWTKALAFDPNLVEARCNLALYRAARGQADEAVRGIRQAIGIQSEQAELHFTLGILELHRGRYEAAATALKEALDRNPRHRRAAVHLAEACMDLCDWDRLERLMPVIQEELEKAGEGKDCLIAPFLSLKLPTSEAERLAVAAARNRRRQTVALAAPAAVAQPKDRLHLGYLSADWRDHPTAHVLCGMFHHHDRRRFEVTALSTGPDDGSRFRAEVRAGCDRFIDLSDIGDRAAAGRIRELGIDILVDVQGPTRLARPGLGAQRPAPVQVLYQAFCGTTAAPWIDYLMVDRVVIPPASRDHYSEALVTLPGCYMVANNTAPVAKRRPSRDKEGLPAEGVVFCSFCNGFKITRRVFGLWMRVLAQVPGAVLWLRRGPAAMQANLRAAAASQGIDLERLVFAVRHPEKADHLARHRLADLFLDTPIYGGHVSALDSLWVGTPLLTRRGETFAARVGASYLTHLGMEELIVRDDEAYEALAVALGRDTARLAALRLKLRAALTTQPLFDTAGWVAGLEGAFQAIWRKHAVGQSPQDIEIASNQLPVTKTG